MEKNVYLHTGSNQGDKKANLERVNQFIAQKIGKIVDASAVYETEAWGKKNQPAFLNQALKVRTSLSPKGVLEKIIEIETQEFARVRTEKWGERVIDIDILLYENVVLNTPELVIPHPQIPFRNFVLVPLMEIAGEMPHPTLEKTIEELYFESTDSCEVYTIDEE